MKKPGWKRFILPAAAVALIAALWLVSQQQAPIGDPVPSHGETGRPDSGDVVPDSGAGGDAAIADAFRDQRSDVWVESSGTVVKLLRDDDDGARHQLFIVQLDSGQTLLISHNIDLAQRVPAREGERVIFRGEYEWNHRGGVVHWTHHDPRGRHPGGHLIHDGVTYR